jgi:hypothetical protein
MGADAVADACRDLETAAGLQQATLAHLLQLATRNARNLLIPHEAIAASAKT